MPDRTNTISRINLSDFFIAFIFCAVFTTVSALFSTLVLHWFILPVILCGVVIGADGVGWFRRKYDLFDPKGILGLLGLHYFFMSQILVVIWEIPVPATAITLYDYRPWIGLIAIFHFFGLIIYRVVEKAVSRKPYNKTTTKAWIPNESRWVLVLTIFIVIACIAQAYLVFERGYIGRIAYDPSERVGIKGGTGIFRLLGSAGPVLLMMFLTLARNRISVRKSSFLATYILLALMAGFAFFFGGLVGSRGATIWSMFWIAGIIHFFWRRFTVKEALIGIFITVLFMNIYGFFKKLGTEGLEIYRAEGWAVAASESGVTMKGILTGDLSRTTVHAYMAYVLVEKPYPYEYRWGKTIWGDILLQFPTWLYPNYYNRVSAGGKMLAGTDLMMGPGSLDPLDPFSKSRYVYGLTGQVMLNFGLLPIPLAFIILGYCIGKYRRALLNWETNDMKFLLAPVAINLLIIILTHDLDNMLYTIIFRAALPFMIIWISTIRIPKYLLNKQKDYATKLKNPLPLYQQAY